MSASLRYRVGGGTICVALVILWSRASLADSVQFRRGESAPPLAINPSSPTTSDVINFTTPLDGNIYGNACGAAGVLGGDPLLARDAANHTIDLLYDGNIQIICPLNWDPVIGAEGTVGPLPAGDWVLSDPHNNTIRFTVIPETTGGFDGDGLLTVTDIDMLTAAVIAATNDPFYDLNKDTFVDQNDRRIWVSDLRQTFFGDANLDSEFNSRDLVEVFEAGEYEDGIAMNSGWSEGDWDGKAEFDTSDLVVAFMDGGYEQGPRRALAAVPEPRTFLMLVVCLFGLAIRERRAKR